MSTEGYKFREPRGNWAEMPECFPFGNRWIAARCAVEDAERDLDDGIPSILAYGGPMAPWTTPTSVALADIGIKTQAVAGCEITCHQDLYADIYNRIMRDACIPWLCFSNDRQMRLHEVLKIVSRHDTDKFYTEAYAELKKQWSAVLARRKTLTDFIGSAREVDHPVTKVEPIEE